MVIFVTIDGGTSCLRVKKRLARLPERNLRNLRYRERTRVRVERDLSRRLERRLREIRGIFPIYVVPGRNRDKALVVDSTCDGRYESHTDLFLRQVENDGGVSQVSVDIDGGVSQVRRGWFKHEGDHR